MNIYDKSEDLALSIKESREYTDFLRSKAKIAKNAQSIALLKEYRQYQIALEFAKLSGEGIEDVTDALEGAFVELGENKEISEYLDAEYKLTCLIQRIQSILTDDLELMIEPMEQESNIYLN